MQIDQALARGIGKAIAQRRATAQASARRTPDWTTRDVARRMTEAGHPMQHSAVSLAQQGKRTISAQEWLTFALILSVSPLSLIDPDESVDLAGKTQDREAFADWFVGRRPLDSVDEPAQFYASAGPTRGSAADRFSGVLRGYADHLDTKPDPYERRELLADIAQAALSQRKASRHMDQVIEARKDRALQRKEKGK